MGGTSKLCILISIYSERKQAKWSFGAQLSSVGISPEDERRFVAKPSDLDILNCMGIIYANNKKIFFSVLGI